MRLNLFSPYLRKRSRLQRFLTRLGPTWAAAPWRRLIQALCLAAFLVLLFYVCWPYGAQDYAQSMARREKLPAESFLALDPLVSVSAALAARAGVFSLAWAAAILALCLLAPRAFCGYLCPLGTLIDCFDWAIGKRITRWRVQRDGGWVSLRYYLLAATLAASLLGVLLSGFFAAIPVLTRGLVFTLAPLQMGLLKGWYLVPPMNAGHYLSIALFLALLALGLLRPRFWCRYLCPSGALFSLASALRLTQRHVLGSCTHCGQCTRICPFDAIDADHQTRPDRCTFCQTCGGVCPTHSIQFAPRKSAESSGSFVGCALAHAGAINACAKAHPTQSTQDSALSPSLPSGVSRRGLLSGTLTGLAAAAGVRHVLTPSPAHALLRPPGSVPEPQFLQLCVRCGECFKACPNNVLQPLGFEAGLDALWTPVVVPSWSGCEPSCNNCGQVCPTSAIRALPIEEKRAARMGLAVVDSAACLPFALREACQLCVDECKAAGYDAIEFMRVGVEMTDGLPVEGSGFLAPVVLAEKCLGCGLCQTRCFNINVKQKHLLQRPAILIEAGPGREDRLSSGSYRALRQQEQLQRQQPQTTPSTSPADGYLPDFLK